MKNITPYTLAADGIRDWDTPATQVVYRSGALDALRKAAVLARRHLDIGKLIDDGRRMESAALVKIKAKTYGREDNRKVINPGGVYTRGGIDALGVVLDALPPETIELAPTILADLQELRHDWRRRNLNACEDAAAKAIIACL